MSDVGHDNSHLLTLFQEKEIPVKYTVSTVVAFVAALFMFVPAFAQQYEIPLVIYGEPYTITVTIEDGELVTATTEVDGAVIGEIAQVEPAVSLAPTIKPTLVPTPAPTPTAAPENLAQDHICKRATSGMTALQRDFYYEELKGKQIAWHGYVHGVSQTSSGYSVTVSDTSYEDSWIYARQVEIRGVPIEIAAEMDLYAEFNYTGEILRIEKFMGVYCNPIIVSYGTIEMVE